MKAILEFDLDNEEDRIKHDLAIKSLDMSIALEEIGQEIFRPARKYGYNNKHITDLLEEMGGRGEELIGLLEDKFFKIIKDKNIEI